MELQNKNITLTITPDFGGAIQRFVFEGKDIFRPAAPNATSPQEQALFLMIPYCSYIKDGHFNYFGINRHVSPNQPANPTPIHGDVWQNKCQVEQQTPETITLSYTHSKEAGFPFDYKTTITYKLEKNSLHITLSIYNPSDLPMPCGMGVHPYFIQDRTALIKFNSSHIWHHQQDPIFDRPYPTPTQWNFAKGKKIDEDFDTAFGGWDGVASITYPDKKLKIEITAHDIFHHLILYAPKGADFFCLEPVSNTPDAFNLAAYGVIGTGIQSVGAKQTLTKTITFTCQNI